MRHFIFSLFVFHSLAFIAEAQPPQGISYQAVVRSAAGAVFGSQAVRLRLSIRDTTATGTIVYQETHQATSSQQGLVNLIIGQGTVVSGTFASINWGAANKYLQVEVDTTGGTSYTNVGTQQMMSVPYALYSLRAGGLTSSSSSGSSFDWHLPDGLQQATKIDITLAPNMNNQSTTITPYTVPSGYNLYITKIIASPRYYNCSVICNTQGVYANNVNLTNDLTCGQTITTPYIIGENMVLDFNIGSSSSGYSCSQVFAYVYGFLAPKTVTIICQNSNYLVPIGKKFVKYGSTTLPEIFPAGTTIPSKTLGYLIAE